MTEIRIRDAIEADRRVLETFMASLQDFEREIEQNRLPGADMAADHVAALWSWAADHPGGCVLLAETGGTAAGFLIAGIEEEYGSYVLPENRRLGRISDLWVEPARREQGIARALIAEAETRMAAAGIRRLEISALPRNAAALALYRGLGYEDALITLARRVSSR